MGDLISREAVAKIMENNAFMVEVFGAKRKMVDGIMMCVELADLPTVEAEPVVHGEWMLKAHKESSNYRWNVTAECSECCNGEKEIWAGFFPDFPDWLARDIALSSAKSVLLSNYCPNCGAKMDGKSKV